MKRDFTMVSISLLCCAAALFGSPGALSAEKPKDKPDHTVELTNIEFKPNRLKVSMGETIRFINRDKFDHDVYLVRTANRNDVLVPATTIPSGGSVTVQIDQEGLFTLYCTIHGGMTAKITTTGTFELTEAEKERAAARKVIPPIVKTGEALYWGRAQCHRCHMVGDRGDGLRGPNHQDLGFRAAARAKKLGLSSATEYIVQSIMEPSAHIVEGYSDDMPKVYQAPIDLGEAEIKALVAYLQSQGGEVDTWAININKQTLATRLAPSPFVHGDARRGRRVFQSMGCGSCHTVGDQKAVSIAPELTAIGAFRNWVWLVQAVTDPNAEIGANWKDVTVYLKPGVTPATDASEDVGAAVEDWDFDATAEETPAPEPTGTEAELAEARDRMAQLRRHILTLERRRAGVEFAEPQEPSAPEPDDAPVETDGAEENVAFGESVLGVLRKESADGVTLFVAGNRLLTIPRSQIARVVVSRKSRMATNYGEMMTFQQLADLVRYLESLKGMPATPSSQTADSGR